MNRAIAYVRSIAYVRVSSANQGKSDIGLQSQAVQIEAFAEGRGYRVIKTYREVASAIGGESLTRRPRLQEAIRHAQRERLPILVARLDRVSRNADELERVAQASGIKIVSVREGPAVDPVTLRVESARISHETKMLRERTLNGLQRAKREGKLFGNRTNLPDAQRKGVASLKRNAKLLRSELRPIIRQIQDSGLTGGEEISAELNRRGIYTARRQKWTRANLARVLRQLDGDDDRRSDNPMWGMF